MDMVCVDLGGGGNPDVSGVYLYVLFPMPYYTIFLHLQVF